MTDKELAIGRLAMRVEDGKWVAYYARTEGMKDALLLGSISMSLLRNMDRRDAFKSLMVDCVADMLEDVTGQRPDWDEEKIAPEHERSGNA